MEWHPKASAGSGVYFLFLLAAVNLLDPITKARLVFWKWADPLPGCRAFSEIAPFDPRIDFDCLKLRLGALPSDPKQQNALWYKLYKKHAQLPSVQAQHASFLTLRDVTALLALCVATAPIAAGWIAGAKTAAIVFFVEVVAFLGFAVAGKNAGRNFVAGVLCEYCTGEKVEGRLPSVTSLPSQPQSIFPPAP